jgi:hypothetical protein
MLLETFEMALNFPTRSCDSAFRASNLHRAPAAPSNPTGALRTIPKYGQSLPPEPRQHRRAPNTARYCG